MFEQDHNRVLRRAPRHFPDGCLCEDCGVCAYCRFILSLLHGRNMNCALDCEQPNERVLPGDIQFKIPTGSLGQIYELRRLFRLCM